MERVDRRMRPIGLAYLKLLVLETKEGDVRRDGVKGREKGRRLVYSAYILSSAESGEPR